MFIVCMSILFLLLQNVAETSSKPVLKTPYLTNSINYTENRDQDVTKNNESTIEEPIIKTNEAHEVNRIEDTNNDKKDQFENSANGKTNQEVADNDKTANPEMFTSTNTEAMLAESDNLAGKDVNDMLNGQTTNIPPDIELITIPATVTISTDELESGLNSDDDGNNLSVENGVENISNDLNIVSNLKSELMGEDGFSNSSGTLLVDKVKEVATNDVQLKPSMYNMTEREFEEVSSLDANNPNEDDELVKTIKEIRDLKDEIKEREENITHLLVSKGGDKELLQIENLLEEIEANNSKLKVLKLQIAGSKYPLDNETLAYIETVMVSAETFLQASRDRLREVEYARTSTEKTMVEGVPNNVQVDDRTAETKSYEELLKEKITSDHLEAHEKEDNGVNEDATDINKSLQKFLVPGLALLVFILLCLSLVLYKVNTNIKSGGLETQVKDGYTELEVKIDENNWDPRDGGRRYQKFK